MASFSRRPNAPRHRPSIAGLVAGQSHRHRRQARSLAEDGPVWISLPPDERGEPDTALPCQMSECGSIRASLQRK